VLDVILIVTIAFALSCALIFVLHWRSVNRDREESVIVFNRPFVPCLTLLETLDTHYGPLCDAHLQLFRLLLGGGAKGVSLSHLQPLYQYLAARYPEIYDGSSFAEWLAFYQAAGIVALGRSSVWLTSSGLRLLQHSESEWFAA
jgi:hypothetical protein